MRTVVGAFLLSSADALVVPHIGSGRVGIERVRSSLDVFMRAPFDPRSATETFEMWTAAAPPEGFVWGYDSRSTTENYEQWLVSEASDTDASPPPATPTTKSGVPSVSEIVLSWYDMGIRISSEATAISVASSSTMDDTAATAEMRAAAELYTMSAADAAAYLEREKPALLAAGVKAADIDAALDVVTRGTSKDQAAVETVTEPNVWPSIGGAPTYHFKRPLPKRTTESTSVCSMSIADTCKFLEMNPNVAFDSKKSFLLSKGVAAFTIAQAACTAPDKVLVL